MIQLSLKRNYHSVKDSRAVVQRRSWKQWLGKVKPIDVYIAKVKPRVCAVGSQERERSVLASYQEGFEKRVGLEPHVIDEWRERNRWTMARGERTSLAIVETPAVWQLHTQQAHTRDAQTPEGEFHFPREMVGGTAHLYHRSCRKVA